MGKNSDFTEEVVEKDFEEVEDRYEVVEEEAVVTPDEPFEKVKTRGYERFKTYVHLFQRALLRFEGYVAKHRDQWFLVAVPGGEPVVKLVFETSPPMHNSYIRVDRYREQRDPESGARVITVYDWSYIPFEVEPPRVSLSDFESMVLNGVEFTNKIFEELYVYHLISSPFIATQSRRYYIGGSRLALFGEHSSSLVSGVLALRNYMHKPVSYVRGTYVNILVKSPSSIFEKVATKNQRIITSVNAPVESIGIVERAPVDYSIDPDAAELIFYYKVAYPVMFLNDEELLRKEELLLRDTLRRVDLRPSLRKIMNTDLEGAMLAVLRLATAVARTRRSSIVTEEILNVAHNRFYDALEEIAWEFGLTGDMITFRLMHKDIVWIIEKYGFDAHGTKCIEEEELVKKLVEDYKLSRKEAEERVERARRSGVIYKPYWGKGLLCLTTQ
ncbi:MAG: hypothetical protein QW764_01725 [Desulfurococcaceae archaeon]